MPEVKNKNSAAAQSALLRELQQKERNAQVRGARPLANRMAGGAPRAIDAGLLSRGRMRSDAPRTENGGGDMYDQEEEEQDAFSQADPSNAPQVSLGGDRKEANENIDSSEEQNEAAIGQQQPSLREQVMTAKREQARSTDNAVGEGGEEEVDLEAGSGGGAIDNVREMAEKQFINQAYKWAWGVLLPSFGATIIVLDFLLFYEYRKKYQVNEYNKLAILFANLIIGVILILILVFVSMTVGFMTAGPIDKMKMLWDLGWAGIEGLMNLFTTN